MQIRMIDNLAEFRAARDGWDELLLGSGSDHVFLTHEWLLAWWEVFGGSHELFILEVKDGEKLLAIAPLMIKKGPVNKLQFIAHEISDYMDFIVAGRARECFEMIFKKIGEQAPRWDWAEFIYLPETSPHIALWKEQILKTKGAVKRFFHDDVCVEIDLASRGINWLDFEKNLPAKRRNDLKRCLKLLNQQGEIEFHKFKDFSRIKDLFQVFVESHKKRWRSKGRDSQFFSGQTLAHYLNLAEKMSGRGWIEVSSLTHKGEPIALAFCYVYAGRYYYYTPAFNPEYARFSPGNLLLKYLIEAAYQDGLEYFDLLRGNEPYKYVWSKAEVRLLRAQIYNATSRGLAQYVSDRAQRKIRPLLRKLPMLVKARDLIKRWRAK